MSRMSSRDRIERLAAEADIAAREKTEAAREKAEQPKTKSAAKSTKKKAGSVASASRQKVVWKIFNVNYKEVAVYPYAQKQDADAMAAKLTTESGQSHFVNSVKVPLEEA
jgi:hypothetical protein